jgi:hypothetical protein
MAGAEELEKEAIERKNQLGSANPLSNLNS